MTFGDSVIRLYSTAQLITGLIRPPRAEKIIPTPLTPTVLALGAQAVDKAGQQANRIFQWAAVIGRG
jgi:hypothetical protein